MYSWPRYCFSDNIYTHVYLFVMHVIRMYLHQDAIEAVPLAFDTERVLNVAL